MCSPQHDAAICTKKKKDPCAQYQRGGPDVRLDSALCRGAEGRQSLVLT